MKKLIPLFLFLFSGLLIQAQNIPDFTITDLNGKEHSLHKTLRSGQAVVLDFFASWCGPCAFSSVELEDFYEDNGSGLGNLEVYSITIESDDDADAINNLTWGGDYPTFAYTPTNRDIYSYYGQDLGFNSTGAIPFFIFICPNQDDPANSTIIKNDVGYQGGMFAFGYQIGLNSCAGATDVTEVKGLNAFKLFPNPANQQLNISLDTDQPIDGELAIFNVLGKKVRSISSSTISTGTQNIEVATHDLANGVYLLSYNTTNGTLTRKFTVSH